MHELDEKWFVDYKVFGTDCRILTVSGRNICLVANKRNGVKNNKLAEYIVKLHDQAVNVSIERDYVKSQGEL